MGWAKGLYYQRSVWRAGRVETEYFGTGLAALGVAIMDREAREARRKARAAARAAEAKERRLFDEERARGRSARLVTECGIEGMGYVRHHRHEWRRRRMRTTTDLAHGAADPGPPAAKDIRALAEEVKAKRAGAYQEFRELAERHPAAVVAAMRLDLAKLSREVLAERMAEGKDGAGTARELALLAQMRLVYEGLAGDRPSPALQLACWDCAFTWIVRQALCIVQAHAGVDKTTSMQLRRGAAAQREYLRAVRTCQRLAAIEGRGRS
jgi:hypothetical protein